METKQKRRKVVVSLLALAGLAVFSVTTGAGNLEPSAPPGPTMKTLDEVEPRIAIAASDLPLTITNPNSYYFTETINFGPNDVDAITIEANDVTIDLVGFSLIGPGSGTGCGIYMNGRRNVEIRDGTVRNFGSSGIYEAGSINGKKHRVINVRSISNGASGIWLYGCSHIIKDCTAAANTYGIIAGAGSTVTGNNAYENGNYGIYTGDGCTITGNTAYTNASHGIYAGNGSTVTGNTIYENNDTGIHTGSSCTVTGNTSYSNNGDGSTTYGHGILAGASSTVAGNTAGYNYGDGIKVSGWCRIIDNTCDYNGNLGDGAGIHAAGSQNRIEGNNVTDSDRGIEVDSADNLIVKNSAANNTTEYVIVGGNKVGTISTDPTTAGPWDNFDF